MKKTNEKFTKLPKISVIMGVYNCEITLASAIESLYGQTYRDFELIMCDDGSKDNTYEIAKQYADKYDNIVLLKNETNKGLNFTLNHCLKYVKGLYIARQDGDDISLPDRFEKEVKALESNPDIAIVSCSLIHFNENGDFKISRNKEYPQKVDFVKSTQFWHACSMIHKSVVDEVEGYTESDRLLRVEDYHLWCKIYARGYKGYNIQEPLYKWRDDNDAYKRRTFKNRINEMYVRFIGFKMLKLPFYCYIFCLRPMITYLLPRRIYNYFHNGRNTANKIKK
jgi:glycosyltransferase EpsE